MEPAPPKTVITSLVALPEVVPVAVFVIVLVCVNLAVPWVISVIPAFYILGVFRGFYDFLENWVRPNSRRDFTDTCVDEIDLLRVRVCCSFDNLKCIEGVFASISWINNCEGNFRIYIFCFLIAENLKGNSSQLWFLKKSGN